MFQLQTLNLKHTFGSLEFKSNFISLKIRKSLKVNDMIE